MSTRSLSRGAPVLLVALFLGGCTSVAAPSRSLTPTASTVPVSSVSPPTTSSPTPAQTPNPTEDWNRYYSAPNRLGFTYPTGWTPLECGWVFIEANTIGAPAQCPIDGAGGILLAGPGVRADENFSTISSSNPGLYGPVTKRSVTVDGVVGFRLAATQVHGQGAGSSQVEYDFVSGTTRYVFLAYVQWPGYEVGDITTQFDELVATVAFG